MNEGDTVSIVIGAGGTGSAGASGGAFWGGAGGNTTVTVNGNTYTAGGGGHGGPSGVGGFGTIPGASCGFSNIRLSNVANGSYLYGGKGAGPGGKGANYYSSGSATNVSVMGDSHPGAGGGSGCVTTTGKYTDGKDGGSGFVWFLYFNPNK